MLVHRGNATNGDSVVVYLSFDIQLLKGSFVRPLVVSVTAPELRRWLESYIKYMRDSINQKKGLSPKSTSSIAAGFPRHSVNNNHRSQPTPSQAPSSHSNHGNNHHPSVANDTSAAVCDTNKTPSPQHPVSSDKDKLNAEASEALVTAVAHQYRLLILLYCTITLCFFLLAILIWNRNQVHALHQKVHRVEELLEMLIKQEMDSSRARSDRS